MHSCHFLGSIWSLVCHLLISPLLYQTMLLLFLKFQLWCSSWTKAGLQTKLQYELITKAVRSLMSDCDSRRSNSTSNVIWLLFFSYSWAVWITQHWVLHEGLISTAVCRLQQEGISRSSWHPTPCCMGWCNLFSTLLFSTWVKRRMKKQWWDKIRKTIR